MNRRVAAFVALVVLLGLTGLTWLLLEGSAGPGSILAVAACKAVVIGVVFLELDRAHPGWLLLGSVMVAGLSVGIVGLLP